MASPDNTNVEEEWSGVTPLKPRKPTAIDTVGGIFCSICQCIFNNKQQYDEHYYQHNVTGEFVYTCVVCRKEIVGYPAFRNHCYGAHVVREKFKCVHCSKKFSKLTVLNAHIDSTHTFKCTDCKETFSSKKELRTHEIIHKNDKHKPPYPCKVCGESIDSLETCELHMDRHCLMEYPCSICDHLATTHQEAVQHLTVHFGEVLNEQIELTDSELSEEGSIATLGGILCCFCEELFENKLEFDVHFSIEHGDQDVIFYTCNICGKEYDKYRQFGSHCYNHVNKDKFACVDCSKTFDRLSLLVLHTETHHSPYSDDACTFSCSECGHKFGSSRRVKEHFRIVHSSDTIRCPDEGCDETFSTLRQLVQHRGAAHARGATCRHCALRLSARAAAAHVRVHRRARLACPVCARRGPERRHAAEHFEATWHLCLVCGRGYPARHRLAEHVRAAHSAARARSCPHCGKSFGSRARLAQHVGVHAAAAARPWRCALCSKPFAARPNWAKHLRRVHRLEPAALRALAAPPEPPAPPPLPPPAPSPGPPPDETDDSTVESIDAAAIAKDWQIVYERSMAEDGVPYAEVLPLDGEIDFEIPEYPQEPYPQQSMFIEGQGTYLGGPQFAWQDPAACCVHAGEACLHSVDPRLACAPAHTDTHTDTLTDTLTDTNTYTLTDTHSLTDLAPTHWDPLITKVYHTLNDNDFNSLTFTDLLC